MIENKLNEKCYIGSAITNRIQVRFRNHFFHASLGSPILQRAIIKYGIENFVFHVLEYHSGFVFKENFKKAHLELLTRETYYTNLIKPEYNILQIADSTLGYKHNEETLLKMKLNYSQSRKD